MILMCGISDQHISLISNLPPENVYGHTKKLAYFRGAIDRFRQRRGLRKLRILDIGCGSGYAVTRFVGCDTDYVLGVDMYQPNIDFANQHYASDLRKFICDDAANLSTRESDRFDVILLSDILEHLDSPEKVLAVASGLLASDGTLLVSVPNGRGPFEIESALSKVKILGPAILKVLDWSVAVLNKHVWKQAWTHAMDAVPEDLPYNSESIHVQFYSKTHICRLLEEAGFNVEHFSNLSFLSGPFTNYLFSPWKSFCTWNTNIADRLPHILVSAWCMECSVFRRGKVDQ